VVGYWVEYKPIIQLIPLHKIKTGFNLIPCYPSYTSSTK
jgi:hypothetical protein